MKYFFIGLYFGIVLIRSEAVSWFRIQEMFHFQSFHMYGIIGSAVVVGALAVQILKRLKTKSFDGKELDFTPKPFNKIGNYVGGTLFGLGWALTGACPGPLYALLGAGYSVIIIPILAALAGVWAYALLKPKLPH